MPPVSNSVSVSSKSKQNRFSTSPDSEPIVPEPDIQPVSSKKKKKNAANKQSQNTAHNERPSSEVEPVATPPPSQPRTILSQIPHGFSLPTRRDSSLLDVQDEEITTTGKVSDQYTPPNDAWLEDDVYGKSPPRQPPQTDHSPVSFAEPGFSKRAVYETKSPPISPPPRHVRPVSFTSGIPPVPALPRASPSAYSYVPSTYGSPPAPHLAQQHFYHAQDVNLNAPRANIPQLKEDPFFIKHTRLTPALSASQHGALLGFEERFHIVRLEGGLAEEVALLEGLSGSVLDAALLELGSSQSLWTAERPLVALVIHGPRDAQLSDQRNDPTLTSRQQVGLQNTEYATRVEMFSLRTQKRLAVLLETPSQMPHNAFRGAPPTAPNPIGQLRLQASGEFLVVSSGVSGEVYTFTCTKLSESGFECVGKFWTAIQPQIGRRDSSHHSSSDVDVSPADLGRAAKVSERSIFSLNGRWLAISPPSSLSRPSLNATIGPGILVARYTGLETTSAPPRPLVSCEVDSPDADTLFGKVARGVAQELVKGARWLGDQGYQTWQNYWRKDQSPSLAAIQSPYSPPVLSTAHAQNAFPPTHGDAIPTPKEPELIAIYDLQALHESVNRRGFDEPKPLATFQPPKGCSYLSFAPHGLSLFTSGRKGDVQYVWDLMQIKHCRNHVALADEDRTRLQPRVRQVAKYERMSPSSIIDVIWDHPGGGRFAVLTKNKTVHLFDLPVSAFRWPPPRIVRRSRPVSKSTDSTGRDTPASSGFFASAMNIATQAQPMIANWRGRAPSMGGGLSGIGQTGIGIASATGARGGKAVAAGLSKSLGAASETVNQMRHAGESRLHLKFHRDPLPDKIFWVHRRRKTFLAILDLDLVKQYQIGRSSNQERRDKDSTTVIAARKAIGIKIPSLSSLVERAPHSHEMHDLSYSGFCKLGPAAPSAKATMLHPLSFAEIDTNSPYQPFHSDRRVILSVYSESTSGSESQSSKKSSVADPAARAKTSRTVAPDPKWVFGEEISTTTLNISKIQVPRGEDDNVGSVIYRETVKVSSPDSQDEETDQIVSTTRRRKVKKSSKPMQETYDDVGKEDGFFEDDCDVLDFAVDRV